MLFKKTRADIAVPPGSFRASAMWYTSPTAASFLLTLSSMGPYVVVGKAPIIFEVWDWQGRHGFLFTSALALLVVSFFSELVRLRRKKGLRQVIVMGLVVISAVQLVLQSAGFSLKSDRNAFDEQFVEGLELIINDVEPGYVYFEFFGGPLPRHSSRYSYEVQFLIHQAAGEAVWLSTNDPQAHLSEFSSERLLPENRLRDIFTGDSLSCTTKIRVLGTDWGRAFLPQIRPILGLDRPEVFVEVVSENCISAAFPGRNPE